MIIKFGINYWQNCTQEPVFFGRVGLNVNGFFREKLGYIRAGKFGERKNITIPKPD